jgi:hypothetical protein
VLSHEVALDAYLIAHHGVRLKEVIADAVWFRSRHGPAAAVETTATRVDERRDEDGAVGEVFTGTLTLNGARYVWRATIGTDSDGKRSVAHLSEFKPVDWRARVRLVR